jgi:hypothetical protein
LDGRQVRHAKPSLKAATLDAFMMSMYNSVAEPLPTQCLEFWISYLNVMCVMMMVMMMLLMVMMTMMVYANF